MKQHGQYKNGSPVTRFLQVLVILGLSGCRGQSDGGQEVYPSRPIKLVVPFGAGGGTDVFSRIIKKAIDDNHLLPQPVVIINQGGAGATIGSRRVKNADPDGYTMLILHDAIMTAKYSKTVDYGPEAFEPIAGTGEVGMLIVVSEDSDYQNLNDLMTAAREKPDQLGFGANLGALTHFAGLQLEQLTPGATFRFAQIGGGANRFSDLIGGHIDVTGFSIEEFVRFRSEGLRGLAYFGTKRHPAAPDVPTAIEQGFDVTSTNTFYWWFPKNTPESKVEYMADVLAKALQTDYVQQKLAEIHCEPIYLRGSDLKARLSESSRRISRVVLRESSDVPNFPALIGGGVLLMIVVVVIQELRQRLPFSKTEVADSGKKEPTGNRGLLIVAAAFTVAYVWLLDTGAIRFLPTTALFILAVGILLSKGQWRKIPMLIMIALVMSFGIQMMFTKVFEVDLP